MKKLVSAVIILATMSSAHAASITATPRAGNDKIVDVNIQGELKPGDDGRFRTATYWISDTMTVFVNLDSSGGSLQPGLEIAEIIHRRGWVTQVAEATLCGSMCATIWLSGAHRWATPRSLLGFHAAYDLTTGREKGVPNAILALRYKEWGLEEDAIIYLTMADPDQAIYLTQESAAKYHIAFEGGLPAEADIQIFLQRLLAQKQQEAPPKPAPEQPNPAPAPSPPPGVRITVVQDLMLRQRPDPVSSSVLEGLQPDHMTPGTLFIAKDFNEVMNNCRQNYLGKVWCALNFHGSDGRLHAGYANGYYLSFDNGRRVACVIRPSLPECQGSGSWDARRMNMEAWQVFFPEVGTR
jgi:hypothetical protein